MPTNPLPNPLPNLLLRLIMWLRTAFFFLFGKPSPEAGDEHGQTLARRKRARLVQIAHCRRSVSRRTSLA